MTNDKFMQSSQLELEFYPICYVVIFREWAWGECTDTIRGVFINEDSANEYISKHSHEVFIDSKVDGKIGASLNIEKHNLI